MYSCLLNLCIAVFAFLRIVRIEYRCSEENNQSWTMNIKQDVYNFNMWVFLLAELDFPSHKQQQAQKKGKKAFNRQMNPFFFFPTLPCLVLANLGKVSGIVRAFVLQ